MLPSYFVVEPELVLEALEFNYETLVALQRICSDKERFEYAVFKPYESFEDGTEFLLHASKAWKNSQNQRFLYGIYHQGVLAGLIELKFLEEQKQKFCSLGYNIGKNHAGYALAQKSAQTLITWVFSNTTTPYFELWHRAENKASARVMEKLGFKTVSGALASITSHKGVVSQAIVKRLYRSQK